MRMVIPLTRRQSSIRCLLIFPSRLAISNGGILRRWFHTLLNAFQISPDALFGITDGVRQFYFGQIMSIKTLDITFVRGSDCFLRLHNLEIVGYARSKTILGLR